MRASISHGATVGARTQLKHNWVPLRPTGPAAWGVIAESGRLEPQVSPTALRAVQQGAVPATSPATASSAAARPSAAARSSTNGHIPLVCSNLEASLEFYQGLLGLERCPDRPDHKLPYRGAWLWIGSRMIQMMEFPTKVASDATAAQTGPADRHFRIAVPDLAPVVAKLEASGVRYARAAPDAPLVEIRDPDGNVVEVVEASSLRAR